MLSRPTAIALSIAALSGLVLSACASNSEGGSGPTGSVSATVSKSAGLADLVPAPQDRDRG